MTSTEPPKVEEPFPIFTLAGKHLLYDIAIITHVRAHHNIPGVLIGGLPQAPQQNVFSGVPLELMPEEARLLCEKGVAYVVDDVKQHKQGFLGRGLGEGERKKMVEGLRLQGMKAAAGVKEKSDKKKEAALGRRLAANGGDWNDIPEDMLTPNSSRPSSRASNRKKMKGRPNGLAGGESAKAGECLNGSSTPAADSGNVSGADGEELLFAPPTDPWPTKPPPAANGTRSRGNSNAGTPREPEPYAVTPTTSYPPLVATPPPDTTDSLADVPPSYPLYKHLHSKDYFLAPGLRFGCQYMAYPGDPLRFHSHFLCNGMDWDQEFDLLDLVGGGRLGTGVKKGFLIGGTERKERPEGDEGGDGEDVRAFTVEWGGM